MLDQRRQPWRGVGEDAGLDGAAAAIVVVRAAPLRLVRPPGRLVLLHDPADVVREGALEVDEA